MNAVVRIVVGALIGGAIGFAMYRFVGCRTGACPLTGNPYIAVVLWGLMGVFVVTAK